MNQYLVRNHVYVRTSEILTDYPCSLSGTALLVMNPNDSDTILSLEDSADGVTYSPVIFIDGFSLASNLTFTLTSKSRVVLLFNSENKFLKIKESLGSGVYADLVQFAPLERELAAESY